ncbi:MAG: hypothetical protein ABI137_05915 [Antricoccus sp.]
MSNEPQPPKPGPVRRRRVRGTKARSPQNPERLGDDLHEFDRGVRVLVTSGPSQLSKDTAMRVRDIDRPTAEDLEDAEQTTELIRRNWQPPT